MSRREIVLIVHVCHTAVLLTASVHVVSSSRVHASVAKLFTGNQDGDGGSLGLHAIASDAMLRGPVVAVAAVLFVVSGSTLGERQFPSYGPNYNENYTVYGTALRHALIGEGSNYDKIMPPRSHVRCHAARP